MGFHHVAITTHDAEATHAFYTEVMGFELGPGRGRARRRGWLGRATSSTTPATASASRCGSCTTTRRCPTSSTHRSAAGWASRAGRTTSRSRSTTSRRWPRAAGPVAGPRLRRAPDRPRLVHVDLSRRPERHRRRVLLHHPGVHRGGRRRGRRAAPGRVRPTWTRRRRPRSTRPRHSPRPPVRSREGRAASRAAALHPGGDRRDPRHQLGVHRLQIGSRVSSRWPSRARPLRFSCDCSADAFSNASWPRVRRQDAGVLGWARAQIGGAPARVADRPARASATGRVKRDEPAAAATRRRAVPIRASPSSSPR